MTAQDAGPGPTAGLAGGLAEGLTGGLAARLSATAVAGVTREFPYAPAWVLRGPADLRLPRAVHPAFYGSYDWHSAVHMHWLLVRLLRRHPGSVGPRAREVLDAHLTEDSLTAEAAYLRDRPGFERPYGWAWLVTLAAECTTWDDPGAARWAAALRPATRTVEDLVAAWLPRALRPVRAGTHTNSAFALALLLDAAPVLGLPRLEEVVRETATAWYLGDRDAPARWEPSGEDFLSPTLCEADLVRRLLPPERFSSWLEGFWPGLASQQPPELLEPAVVGDRGDGHLGHLDGLNLSRAAALRALAGVLPQDDARRPVLESSADAHLAAGAAALAEEDYLSTHWLGTFAVLATSGERAG